MPQVEFALGIAESITIFATDAPAFAQLMDVCITSCSTHGKLTLSCTMRCKSSTEVLAERVQKYCRSSCSRLGPAAQAFAFELQLHHEM